MLFLIEKSWSVLYVKTAICNSNRITICGYSGKLKCAGNNIIDAVNLGKTNVSFVCIFQFVITTFIKIIIHCCFSNIIRYKLF